jgi:DNA-binding CsgD family transcriptional regulator
MRTLGVPRLGKVQKQAALILAYKAEGVSTAGIARILGVSSDAVGEVLRAAGVTARRQTPHAHRQNTEREKILVLRTRGKNGEEIARELGIPVNRVYTAVSQARDLDPRFSLGKSHLTQDELDQIAGWRTQGLSAPQIARKLGRSDRTLYRAFAKLDEVNIGQDPTVLASQANRRFA